MRRRFLATAALAALAMPVATGAQQGDLADQREQLRAATQASRIAAARARSLAERADAAEGEATEAATRRAAIAARAEAAEADIATARARIAIIDRLAAAQRARLAERQAPTTRLVAALQSLARRPAALGLLQPGSTRDAVHVRAVLATVIPAVRQRSEAVRRDIARTRALRAQAASAAAGLRDGRRRLERERLALVQAEAASRLRAQDLERNAMVESDRALALGEEARDIVDRMASLESAAATGDRLRRLSGPLPRPASADEAATDASPPPYRLPVEGAVVAGLGELSPSGVRSRGLTIAVPPRAVVRAPAGGRVAYARPFLGYGTVVIIDHGGGWTSLIAGLRRAAVAPGAVVAPGDRIGRSGGGDGAGITVELRRRGRPVDLVALLG